MFGTQQKPRVAVFRSNRYLFVQVIDDEKRVTLLGQSDRLLKQTNKLERAKALGILLAQELIKKQLKEALFDRSGYTYHGRVKAVAEGLREGGIKL